MVEDNPSNQKLIQQILEKMGLETIAVDDGRQAVDRATSEPFDMIFMDIQMPEMNGYDATRGERRFQIKTRKSWSTPNVNRVGRLGRFGRKKGYDFHVAVYLELDADFSTVRVRRMGVNEIKELEQRERSGKGLHVGTFLDNVQDA